MSQLVYVERKGSDCNKWDGQTTMFGEENLHAMWVADMDYKVPACVMDAMRAYVDFGVMGYYKIPQNYYDSFINWEKTYHGYEVKKEWMRFAPGVVPAINWMLQMLTHENDSVITLTPVYYPFLNAINNNKRKLIDCDLINDHGVYSIDFEAFEKKIVANDVKAFILCSPHNPVARVWKKEELARLMEICRKHHVYVISDEIHHDLTFGGHVHYPTATVGEYDDMLITVTAATKTFNLAGCQNSIVVIPDEKLRGLWDAFTTNIRIVSGNALGYIAVEAAYSKGRAWFEELKQVVEGNAKYASETLMKALPGVVVSPLEGTYLLWIDLGAYVKPEEIKEFMQGKCKLALDYGEWFGGERFGSFVRMNLATKRENVEIAVNRMIDGLKK